MIYRKLGPTGIKLSVIGLANWLNSDPQDQQTTNNIIKTAWELGINFFDTSEAYGYGQGQRQLGKALKALDIPRHHFILSTKIYRSSSDNIPTLNGLSRKHIIEGVKNSLKRLDFDYLDIVFCHRYDSTVPMQEICRAFDWIIRQGLSFYWGTNEWNQEHIAEAHMVCTKFDLVKPVIEQSQYNIFTRDNIEVNYRKLFESGTTGSVTWTPPDVMMFAGHYFGGDKGKRSMDLDRLGELAKQLGCTMGQLAMAWCISNPDVTTAITGASNKKQLIATVKSLQVLPKLTSEVQKKIEEMFNSEPNAKLDHKTLGPLPNRRKALLNYL